MMHPLISIVTVSLNAEATIGDTIASVAGQDARFGIEHICVDGGSRDGTRKVIDLWSTHAPALRRIYEPDAGIFHAMNKGLKVATGEYVLFLNADDFLVSPDALAKALRGLSPGAMENPDLIACRVTMGKLGRVGFWRHRTVPRLLGRLSGWGLFPPHQGLFAKRRLLNTVGGFDTTMKLASDTTLFYDMEFMFRPSIRAVHNDLAFMRAGGAANAGIEALWNGTFETFAHLSLRHTRLRALLMVLVKSFQSIVEFRFSRCPHERWFAAGDGDCISFPRH